MAFALVLALFVGVASAEPWSFGVMSDTQWKNTDVANNPNTVAVGIINQINQEFINKGVKFVIQVGDLTDNGSSAAMSTRAAAAQALYDAGIGFYPFRGNHESSLAAALQFQTLYPQTQNSGPYVFGAMNFSSPFATLNGLSYSFDYDNARFVLLDQFTRTDNTNYLGSSNNNIIDQQGWIDMQLSTKPGKSHAFVFSHKGLITENHVDTLFGSNPSSNPDAQNAFMSSLAANGVRYYMGGHDHMHNRAIIISPDSKSAVQDITTASNSYKFYIPQVPSNDEKYNIPANGITNGPRETPISQELFTVGYYIVTVDGPRVTVDFYSSPNGCIGDCDLVNTPTLTFTKRETFGYSLNGQEFLVAEGESYSKIEDSFEGTTARLLSGANGSTTTDYSSRALTKAVNTGWTPMSNADDMDCSSQHRWPWFFRNIKCHKAKDHEIPASDILTLWGMSDLGTDQTDTYALSMSYDHHRLLPAQLGRGLLGLATRDQNGNWVNAVDMNFGGNKKFVLGPWKPGYELGAYGIDLKTHTAWAVINYTGDFAVAGFRHF